MLATAILAAGPACFSCILTGVGATTAATDSYFNFDIIVIINVLACKLTLNKVHQLLLSICREWSRMEGSVQNYINMLR